MPTLGRDPADLVRAIAALAPKDVDEAVSAIPRDAAALSRDAAASPLPELPIQYADFAQWQRSRVTDDVLRRQLDWWRGTLAGMPLGPAVPFDHVPATPTRRIASRALAVRERTRLRLETVARATGSTVFTVAVAADILEDAENAAIPDVS